MPKINDIQPGNCGTFSAESAVGVVPGRSLYSQEGAGRHRTTDPGLSVSHQAHPGAGVCQGCQFERTTGRGNNLQKRKPENINAGLFQEMKDLSSIIPSILLMVMLTLLS